LADSDNLDVGGAQFICIIFSKCGYCPLYLRSILKICLKKYIKNGLGWVKK
jgi:predicted nucleic-acid-binding Zn-ribbon protein